MAEADQARHFKEMGMDTQGEAQTSMARRSLAILDIGRIKLLAKKAEVRCRVVHKVREEHGNLNVGILFVYRYGVGGGLRSDVD
jgi:hypothetical protein